MLLSTAYRRKHSSLFFSLFHLKNQSIGPVFHQGFAGKVENRTGDRIKESSIFTTRITLSATWIFAASIQINNEVLHIFHSGEQVKT
jgi:hypothetical protein